MSCLPTKTSYALSKNNRWALMSRSAILVGFLVYSGLLTHQFSDEHSKLHWLSMCFEPFSCQLNVKQVFFYSACQLDLVAKAV